MMVSRRSFIKKCVSTLVGLQCLEFSFKLPVGSGAGNRQIPVLLYHRVGYTPDYLTVSPERFESDLQTLQQYGYCAITLEQMQLFLDDRNIEMPDKPILITFDDGYLDNYQHAYPILKKYGMVATFFVITSMLWTENRLTPENIAEMAQGGMSFGSHTVSHKPLAEIPWADLHDELVISKSVLESVLGRAVTAVAYPRGSYNQNVINSARNIGYTTAFTVKEGICLKD